MEKYGDLKKYFCGVDRLKEEALKWAGALAITYIAVVGGGNAVAAEAENSPGQTHESVLIDEFEKLSQITDGFSATNLHSGGNNRLLAHDLTTLAGIDNWAKDVMSVTERSAKAYSEFEETGVKIVIVDGLTETSGVYGAYSPESKKVMIDSDFFKQYHAALNSFLQTENDKFNIASMHRLLKHEVIHAVTGEKLKLGSLDAESSILGQTGFEVEARVHETLEAAELGGYDWVVYKTIVPETALKIEEKAKKEGWKIGKLTQDNELEKELSIMGARSFSTDIVGKEHSVADGKKSSADIYKEFHSNFAAKGYYSGRMSLSPAQIIEKTSLTGIVSPAELTKIALPTKKEVQKILKDYPNKFAIDKVPTLEKASSWIYSELASRNGEQK